MLTAQYLWKSLTRGKQIRQNKRLNKYWCFNTMENLKSWCKYQAPENILEADITNAGTKGNALSNIHKITKKLKSTPSDKPVFKTELSQKHFKKKKYMQIVSPEH